MDDIINQPKHCRMVMVKELIHLLITAVYSQGILGKVITLIARHPRNGFAS